MTIDAHQYVLDSVWGDAQPGDVQPRVPTTRTTPWRHARGMTALSGIWLTDSATDDTKSKIRVRLWGLPLCPRSGLLACQYRATEWRHKEIELAPHTLLQHLDDTRA